MDQYCDPDVSRTVIIQHWPTANHTSWSEAFPLLIRDVAKGQQMGRIPYRVRRSVAQVDGVQASISNSILCVWLFFEGIVRGASFRQNGRGVNTTTNIPLTVHHDGVKHIARWKLGAASSYPDDVDFFLLIEAAENGAVLGLDFAKEFLLKPDTLVYLTRSAESLFRLNTCTFRLFIP